MPPSLPTVETRAEVVQVIMNDVYLFIQQAHTAWFVYGYGKVPRDVN